MLTGYFDESGIHKGYHLCVVAGFVGEEAQWGSLAHDWIKALGRRKNLHMKRLRWNKQARVRELLANLGTIPWRYNLTPIVGGVWLRDYEEVAKGRIVETFANPYMI